MKRFFAAALALGLAAMLVHVPSASAAAAISQQQSDELTASYMYLTQDFYQKVDSQNVLNGAHTGILALLKTEGVKIRSVADRSLRRTTSTTCASCSVKSAKR